jgi:hypothetical protein
VSAGQAGNGGTAPRVTDEHFVAVYDPADGKILDIHTVRIFEGGRSVAADEATEEAVKAAKERGHATGRLHTLHVKELPGQGRYRVDLTTKRLAALEVPKRRWESKIPES